jgi:hypothetical protein
MVGLIVGCGSNKDISQDEPSGAQNPGPDQSGFGNPDHLPLPSDYTDTECVSNKRFFVEQVWTPVLATRCMNCHSSLGQAKQSRLILQDAYQTGFLDRNLETFEEVASYSKDGQPLVLLKPLGEDSHGGGIVLKKDSPEHNALAVMVERLKNPIFCDDVIVESLFKNVELLDSLETLRKARVTLTSTLPTEHEIDRIDLEGPVALASILDDMMTEPEFFVWLKEVYNDFFRTDAYAKGTAAIDLLSDSDFPTRHWFEDCDTAAYPMCNTGNFAEAAKEFTNWSVAQDALELVVHVVRNDKPFTEILTADYMMVNPYSARVYDVHQEVYFNAPLEHREFRPAKVSLGGADSGVPYPHAGVLTSPAWLNRFPTTDTNVNRHRSRMVYSFFLATDVLKLAERSLDQSQITAHNPTMNESACAVCHAVVDPIAGAFQNWNNNGRFRPPDEGWHQDMRPPGFGAEVIPALKASESLQWLGQKLVADRRFVTSVVHTMFEGVMGHSTLQPPSDPKSPDYSASLSTYLQQDEYLKTIEEAFMEDNYNLKTAIREIILSPYFRAKNYNAEQPHGGGAAEVSASTVALNQVGTGRLLTPERLNRRLENVMGYAWLDSETEESALLTTYRLFYGGIDFKKDMIRVNSMSGMMANVAQRMANEVACQAVAYDFTLPPESRTLFPYVEWDYAATEKHGFHVPEMVEFIKTNIVYLHSRLLGETLTTDSDEFARTYSLFMGVMEKGQQLLENELTTVQIPTACHATMDLETGEELPMELQMVNDPDYTIRAWMAVTAYLLSDYRFLFE